MVQKTVIIQEFQDLINKLEKDIAILEAQDKKKDAGTLKYKIRTFQKVIQSLKHSHLTEIKDSSQVKDLPGIGKGSLTRIGEIIQAGNLKEAHTKFDQKDLKIIQDIQDLESVTGIGPAHAAQFRKDGITLQLLKDEYVKLKDQKLKLEDSIGLKHLTHHQMIGLKYYEQFQKRVPRKEIDHIRMTIYSLIEKYKTKKNLQSLEGKICGSYRRGCPDSGDIDLLVKGDDQFSLTDFVQFLTEEKFLIDHLTEKGTTKYMGVTNNQYRIDIRFVSKESWGAALMYFTGSKTFNTLVRAKALELGYTLEEYGVYPLLDPKKDHEELKNRKKQSHSHQHLKGKRIDCPNEEKIFQLLGIDEKYLEPHQRDLTEKVTKL